MAPRARGIHSPANAPLPPPLTIPPVVITHAELQGDVLLIELRDGAPGALAGAARAAGVPAPAPGRALRLRFAVAWLAHFAPAHEHGGTGQRTRSLVHAADADVVESVCVARDGRSLVLNWRAARAPPAGGAGGGAAADPALASTE
jgi:alpha-ketoglutarate-dependent taurine dioxygenase